AFSILPPLALVERIFLQENSKSCVTLCFNYATQPSRFTFKCHFAYTVFMENGRSLALRALNEFRTNGVMLESTFANLEDVAFAKEIAFGTLRRMLELAAYAKQLNDNNPLRVKGGIKLLIYMAIYQLKYMDKVPIYAIVDESVKLAKKIAKQQASFLNALLRKLESFQFDEASLSKSDKYSVPPFLLEKLDLEDSVYAAMLERPQVFYRLPCKAETSQGELVEKFPFCSAYKLNGKLDEVLNIDGSYIQNITPIKLMAHLARGEFTPSSILDVCASPGGKVTLAHAIYPQAKLWANDFDSSRLDRLKENLNRLKIEADILNLDGTTLPIDQLFDLIILDVPCSNSGVLAKKPEAKYRINDVELNRLTSLQKQLVSKACEKLNPGGQMWILTCSILNDENQQLVSHASNIASLKQINQSLTLLPSSNGQDGGFCAAFQKR
ncbi:MAG: transcription antitermination factor NusB, partial [Rhabdochlamydiaceae bacterium]|nr:transcription antitermination factor NusB [Candidatus Amphrikana amoebophyrae]